MAMAQLLLGVSRRMCLTALGLKGERVESLLPEVSKRLEPGIDLNQGGGLHCVHAPGPNWPNGGEPGLA